MSALDSIRQRAENATPGPWDTDAEDATIYSRHTDDPMFLFAPHHDHVDGRGTPSEDCTADAEFVAAARTDIPRLLAALDAVMELRRFSIMKNDPVNEYGHGYNAALIKVRAAITQALGEKP